MEEQRETSERDILIGEWLAALRISRVISLEQVANGAGLTTDCLVALETGWASATLAELGSIGRTLGADLLTILMPALVQDTLPLAEPLDRTAWSLQLNRCARNIHDARALALLDNCAAALREREIED